MTQASNSLPPPGEVTELLRRAASGDESVGERLYALLYDHLRSVASGQIGAGAKGATLQPTALVHEAWLRMTEGAATDWRDREHFLAVAARAAESVYWSSDSRGALGRLQAAL